jgi:hypothetical protein
VAVSRCVKCGVDYGRDRLASLAILCRGRPFAVSAEASWKALRDEYMYPHGVPDAVGAGWTDAASAPNSYVYTKVHV